MPASTLRYRVVLIVLLIPLGLLASIYAGRYAERAWQERAA
jgi:two-component system C4-dicarboxylate transport sensor histidine kinase DctB